MPNQGLSFYATNAQRRYPLDDAASAETDEGMQLPPDILVDCYLLFPEAVGRYAFVSSIHASPHLVSVTFLAADRPAVGSACESSQSHGEAEFVPIGAVTIPRSELISGQQYPIESMYPGAGGWVVFGPCRQLDTFSGLFSTVDQSMLSPRVARSYQGLPVDGIGKLANEALLTGLVQLREGPDIRISKETREIDGVERDVIVIALDNDLGRNTLDLYRGPCSGRPESKTCLVPAIESINAVTPDCNGNIEIELISECAALTSTNSGGLLLDFCLGLGDACTEDDMPLNGKLPNDYDDYCIDNEWSSEILNEEEGIYVIFGTQWGEQSFSQESSFELPCVDFPHYEDFRDGGADYLVVHHGAFSCIDGAFKATSPGHRNIAIWEGCTYPTMMDQQVTAEFIIPAIFGRPHAGVILDWKHLDENESYYVIEADKSTDSFRVRFWTGTGYVMVDRRQGLNIKFNQQYAITVSCEEHDTFVRVTAQLREDDAFGATMGQIVFDTRRMKLPGGHIGLIADNSQASFIRLLIGDPVASAMSSEMLSSSEELEEGYSSLEPCDLPLSNVLAYWPLNQSYDDVVAGINLEATGTPSFVEGVHGKKAVRLSDGASLSTDDADVLSLGMHAITISGWVRFNTVPEEPTMIVGKFDAQSIEWVIYADADGIHGVLSDNSVTEYKFSPKMETFGSLQAGDWIFFCLTYNRDTKTVEFELNADHRRTYSYNKPIFAGGYPVHIGKKPILWLPGDLDADVAAVSIFDVALSRRQRECLYMTGIDLDELDSLISQSLSPAFVPTPISFWPLNEASDTQNRRDMMNHNDLLYMIGAKSSTTGLIDGSVDFSGYGWPLFHENTSGNNDLSKGFASFSMGGWLYGPAPNFGEWVLAGVWCVDNQKAYCLKITQQGYKAVISTDGTDETTTSEYDEVADTGSRERFWRHVMLVFDSTTGQVTLYYNGRAMPPSTAVAALNDSAAPFLLGSSSVVWQGPSGGYGAIGAVPLIFDDWGWWDVALTEEHIQTIYNNGNGWQPDV